MNRILMFEVSEDEYFLIKKELKTFYPITSVSIRARESISLIALSGIVEYIEVITGDYEFEWVFEIDAIIPDGKVNVYLYPMTIK